MPLRNAAPVCFALFVFAGYYKAADSLQFIPIDLTLLFAALTCAFCGVEVWRTRALGPGFVPMAAVFLTLAIGFRWPEHFSSYAAQKELRLFSLTALAAFAPLLLLRTDARYRAFAYAACLLGLLMAGVAAIEAAQQGLSLRARIFNTNPILLGRAGGFAALVLCLLYWQGRLISWLFVPAMLLALFGLVASGTKAPLLGLVLATAASAPLALMAGGMRNRIWASLAVGSVGLAGALAALAWAGVFAARRIAGPLTGEWGFAGETRLALWRETLQLIPLHSFGVGWGHFTEWVQLFENRTLMQHPHNIALEIAIEAGWLAGAAFLALIAIVLYRCLRRLYEAPAPGGVNAPAGLLLVFAGLLYWLICAAFSGDVNDNRPLWALIGVTVAALGIRRGARPDGREGSIDASGTREPATGA